MKHILFSAIFILAGCGTNSDNLNTKVLGKWTTNQKPVQGNIIDIKMDSIYYPNYDLTYKYTITKDSFKIFFPEQTFEARYVLKDDTLLFFTYNRIDTSFRIH